MALRNVVEPIQRFRDESITPVYRHWICDAGGCDGEMKNTGNGITAMGTSWLHRCDKCGREEWAGATYPRVAYIKATSHG